MTVFISGFHCYYWY